MSRAKKIVYAAVTLLLAASTLFILKKNKTESENRVGTEKNSPVRVIADTIASASIVSQATFSGVFEPYRESKISADVQGKVTELLVDAGSEVTAGDALVQLDNSLLKLQLKAVEVQIEGLNADINRYTVLSEHEAIQNVQLEKSQLGLKAALVQKAILEEQIRKTTIRAPFDGVVTLLFTEQGAFAGPGVPLLQLTEIKTLRFTSYVGEQELSAFRTNDTYVLTADAFPDLQLNARLTMIGSKANQGNSFPVQMVLNNVSGALLKPGMFGKIKRSVVEQEKGILVPTASITAGAGQLNVYVVKNGKAHLRPVTVSERKNDSALITSGLSPGEVIVTRGLVNLTDGCDVIPE